MPEWILLVFVLVNSINPVFVRVFARIYLCESLPPAVLPHDLCSVLTEPLFRRTSPPLCHHCAWCLEATTASTSIIQPGWHPPGCSCRGVSFWIVQPTFSLYWNVTKKIKKVAWCGILLFFFEVLMLLNTCLFFSCFPRCFFNINPEKGMKVEKSSTSHLHVNPKVLTLIQDLSDHEWQDIWIWTQVSLSSSLIFGP